MDVVANIVKLGVSAKTVIDKSNAHYTAMHSRKNDWKKFSINQLKAFDIMYKVFYLAPPREV